VRARWLPFRRGIAGAGRMRCRHPDASGWRIDSTGTGSSQWLAVDGLVRWDKANVIRGLLDMFSIMYPQLQPVDFRADVPELDVPVWVLDGANEIRGRRELALEWFEQLAAPSKELVTYADAGHSVVFEQADAFHRLMIDEIVPATYPLDG
jgi:pimeloyl-ACP methyl ester carboxylesterase